MGIKIEDCIFASPEQIEFVIMGMRNPMNSWNKSDSYAGFDCRACGHIERDGSCIKGDPEREHCHEYYGLELGPNDKSLMQSLSKAGSEHRKYLRMLPVWCNITAPLYWWKEFDTYKVGTVANSCSTMHKIADKEFTLEDFSTEHICIQQSIDMLKNIIDALNVFRDVYLNGGNLRYKNGNIKCFGKKDKEIWWQMIQLLPSSYNQKRSIFMNGEVLLNIYNHRWGHKLDEWKEFTFFVEDSPYWDIIQPACIKKVPGKE